MTFICPACKKELKDISFITGSMVCECGREVKRVNGYISFVGNDDSGYDEVSGDDDFLEHEFSTTYDRFIRYFLPFLRKYYPSENTSVLMLGCGGGADLIAVADGGYENVIGVDIGWRSRYWREKGHSPENFFVADGKALPFGDNSFDVVISLGVIEHVGAKGDTSELYEDYFEQRLSFIKEGMRVLKEGGSFIVSCPNRFFPIDFQHNISKSKFFKFVADKTGLSFHSPFNKMLLSYFDIDKLAESAGGFKTNVMPLKNYLGLNFRNSPFLRPLSPFLKFLFAVFDFFPSFVRKSFLNPYMISSIVKGKRKPRIAILGIRGVPASYSGYETFAYHFSLGLVKLGFPVVAYGRKKYVNIDGDYFKGVRVVVLPTISHKYFDTVVHTFFAVIHSLFADVEIVYICNTINSIWAVFPLILGKRVWINVDGLEWKRTKWNKLGKLAYRVSEFIASKLATEVITDSMGISKYYLEKFNRKTVYISYGAEIKPSVPPGAVMKKYSLEKRKFFLYVSRLEPENNAHVIIEGYGNVDTDYPLVIVGDAPYAGKYISYLKEIADERVVFTGYLFGNGCDELRSNAFVYLHGNEVGGTNPGLLEAMSFGNCVVVNGVDFNIEVVGNAGYSFKHNDSSELAKVLKYLLDNPEEAEKKRGMAIERIKKYYSWEKIIREYAELILQGRDTGIREQG